MLEPAAVRDSASAPARTSPFPQGTSGRKAQGPGSRQSPSLLGSKTAMLAAFCVSTLALSWPALVQASDFGTRLDFATGSSPQSVAIGELVSVQASTSTGCSQPNAYKHGG
jgi:hypothetical protein